MPNRTYGTICTPDTTISLAGDRCIAIPWGYPLIPLWGMDGKSVSQCRALRIRPLGRIHGSVVRGYPRRWVSTRSLKERPAGRSSAIVRPHPISSLPDGSLEYGAVACFLWLAKAHATVGLSPAEPVEPAIRKTEGAVVLNTVVYRISFCSSLSNSAICTPLLITLPC